MTAAHPRRLRRHQALALDALDRAWAAGRRRAWVELPPGAGKTLVGLETATRLLAGAGARPRVDKVVVLGPNTAIQGQWVDQGRGHGLDPGTDRSLDLDGDRADLPVGRRVRPRGGGTRLCPRAARSARPLTARLHENGAALVARLRDAGPLLLVLDECHHLLEVWGRLLGELLEQLPARRRAGAHRHPARDPDGRPGRARRRAVRRRGLRGLHPGRRARGRPGAVRRAGLAHRADRRRVGLAGRARRAGSASWSSS